MDLNVGEIAIFLALLIKLVINKSMIKTHLEVCGEAIILPVSQAIRYDLALEVWHPRIRILSFGVNSPQIEGSHQEGNDDSSMFLT